MREVLVVCFVCEIFGNICLILFDINLMVFLLNVC